MLGEISKAWSEDYSRGGKSALLEAWEKPSDLEPGKTLLDEDVHNITEASQRLQSDWQGLLEDTSFLIEESERINRIVQSMRGLSITKSDKRIHSVNDLLRNSKEVMADYAGKEQVELVDEVAADWKVAVDKDEFLQSLTNLIRNSVQAIVEKKGRRELR